MEKEKRLSSDYERYIKERQLSYFVVNGQVEEVSKILEESKKAHYYDLIGTMSSNPLMNMKYAAVAGVTIVTRLSIQNGVIATDAYSTSDKFIQTIDKSNDTKEVFDLMMQMFMDFTLMNKKVGSKYSSAIRKAIEYISSNIEKKINLNDLAEIVQLSPDYLSAFFKKETGENVSNYIIKKKLEYAKAIIESEGYRSSLASDLAFCSQSYFISCF